MSARTMLQRLRTHLGKRRRKRDDKRGIALLLVMSSIALMTITVVDFQEEQTSELQAAYAQRDALQAEYEAHSAVNLARLWVASEPLMRSSLGLLRFLFGGKAVPQLPVWEFSDQVLGAFSDKSGAEGFAGMGGFDMNGSKNLGGPEGASFKVVVIDEDSKINLNLGARGNVIAENRFGTAFYGLTLGAQNDPLFEKNDRDGNTSSREVICGALMDWADPDENLYTCRPFDFQGGGGAGGGAGEDTSSQLLPRPYRTKNAPYDSLEEARLVRGMGDDFWSTFVDPDPSEPKKRVMTVWGQGPLNVNTATPQAVFGVLCGLQKDAVVCNDITKQAQFLSMFGVLRTFTAGMPLFGTTQDFVQTVQGGGVYGKMLFESLGIPPFKFPSPAEAAKNFTTESKVFSIYATGEVKGPRRETRVRIHVVVDYRNAPAIPNSPFGGAPGQAQPGQAGQPALLPGQTQAPKTGTPAAGATGADAILGALNANPGGQIVYYRIE
ncbi:MAG: general secretion pathway protein GspK [Polyangiales bacterium]